MKLKLKGEKLKQRIDDKDFVGISTQLLEKNQDIIKNRITLKHYIAIDPVQGLLIAHLDDYYLTRYQQKNIAGEFLYFHTLGEALHGIEKHHF